MNRINICKNIIQSIRNYITNPDNLAAYREKNRFVRKRKLSIFHVIMYLLFTSKASMYQNLFRIRMEMKNLKFPDVSKQALSKARQFIHPDLFRALFNISVDTFYKQLPKRRTWNGYHLFAIDGSKIELPNSKSNFEFFGDMFTYPNPERRFTMGLASIIYDVLDDYIVHASFNPYLTSERWAAKDHIANLEELDIFSDSIVIFDRGYYSEGMFRFFTERNHLCLMRLKANMRMAKHCHGDTLSVLPGNSDLGTEDEQIRVIKVDLPNGTKEYLATNIFDPGITQEMFRELYFYRWPIEVKYRELKDRLCLEEFSGATAISVMQEFYINVLLSNLASLIKNEADDTLQISPECATRHRYQVNRSFIIGGIKLLLPKILCRTISMSCIKELLDNARQTKGKVSPGRSFPRSNLKLKGRRHYKNQKVAF